MDRSRRLINTAAVCLLCLIIAACAVSQSVLQQKSNEELEVLWTKSSPMTREAVVEEIERRNGQDSLITLLTIGNSARGRFTDHDRISIINSLGRLKSVRAIDATANYLYRDSEAINDALLDLYRQIGDESAIEPITTLLKNSKQSIRWKALDVIGDLKPENCTDRIVPLLFDEDANVRWKAIDTLMEIDDSSAANSVSLLLADIDPTVRLKAETALKQFGLENSEIAAIKRKAKGMIGQKLSLEMIYSVQLSTTAARTGEKRAGAEADLSGGRKGEEKRPEEPEVENGNVSDRKSKQTVSELEKKPVQETLPPPGGGIEKIANPGDYHALVIGNIDYRHLPDLETARTDAEEISDVLAHQYGFQTRLIVNGTRIKILTALDQYRGILGENDNLLIYYAGHGYFDKAVDRGYWLPVDSEQTATANWISTADITDKLKAYRAKHVTVVVDSCYSGALTRGVHIRIPEAGYLQRIVQKRTRTVLTSGGLEPVVDGGGEGHSVFAKAFLDALRENTGIMDGTTLFTKIRRPVMLNAYQTPQYSDIRFAGHEGGDFVFIRRR